MTSWQFDKVKFSELMQKALGERNMSEYALHSGVSLTYISELIKQERDNPPLPKTIRKLAEKAHNGITYEMLMEAAGHLPKESGFIINNSDGDVEVKVKSKQNSKDIKDLQKFLDQQEIMFDGVPLTEDDKAKVRKALEIVFWDAKAQNKKARAEAKARREKSD